MNPLLKIQTAKALHAWANDNQQPQGADTIEIPLFNPTIPDADLRTLRQEVDDLADKKNPPVATKENTEGKTVLVFPRKTVEYIAGVSKTPKLAAESEEAAAPKPRNPAAKPPSQAPVALSPDITGLAKDIAAAIAETKRPSVIAPSFSTIIPIDKEKEPELARRIMDESDNLKMLNVNVREDAKTLKLPKAFLRLAIPAQPDLVTR